MMKALIWSAIAWLWNSKPVAPVPSTNREVKQALAVSDELIATMRERSQSRDPARALMADIWSQRHNIPYMTTMVEAASEMNVAGQFADEEAERRK